MLNIKQDITLKQKLILSQRLQVSLKFLQVSRLELVQLMRQELDQNPLIEDNTGIFEAVSDKSESPDELKEVTIDEKFTENIDWNNYISEFNTPGKLDAVPDKKSAIKTEEVYLPEKETLSKYLLWQLGMSLSDDKKKEYQIGTTIIGNLDENGYLTASINQIVKLAKASRYMVEKVLALMKTFEPPGVCTSNLQESLLIQADRLEICDMVVMQIIKKHLKNLKRKNFTAISENLKLPVEHIILAANLIKGLEPYPGRIFDDEIFTQYIIPDLYVKKIENRFVVIYNDDGLPHLHLTSFYKNTLSGGEKINPKVKEYIKKKISAAMRITESIHKRKTTICKVAESIVGFQKNFFEKGIDYLKPLILTDVANEVGIHKSTVSRATTNKYLHCQHGIFELKYFFNNSVKITADSVTTSTSIMEKLKQIIKKEPPQAPYDDRKLAEILSGLGINVSRRTVSKYRNKMNLLPSAMRRQI